MPRVGLTHPNRGDLVQLIRRIKLPVVYMFKCRSRFHYRHVGCAVLCGWCVCVCVCMCSAARKQLPVGLPRLHCWAKESEEENRRAGNQLHLHALMTGLNQLKQPHTHWATHTHSGWFYIAFNLSWHRGWTFHSSDVTGSSRNLKKSKFWLYVQDDYHTENVCHDFTATWRERAHL